MSEKILFSSLKQMLSAKNVQWQVIDDYVEFDPNSSIPKLRLRVGIISDLIPHDFDIDAAIYTIINAENRRKAAARRSDPAFSDRIQSLPKEIPGFTTPYIGWKR